MASQMNVMLLGNQKHRIVGYLSIALIGRNVHQQRPSPTLSPISEDQVEGSDGEGVAEGTRLMVDRQVAKGNRIPTTTDDDNVVDDGVTEPLHFPMTSQQSTDGFRPSIINYRRFMPTKPCLQAVQTDNYLALLPLKNSSNRQGKSSAKATHPSFRGSGVDSMEQVELTLQTKISEQSSPSMNTNLAQDAANQLGLITREHSNHSQHQRTSFTAMTLGRAKSKVLRKAIFILFAYILCWSPYNIMALWNLIHMEALLETNIDFLSNLIVLNAILNPLIYGISP